MCNYEGLKRQTQDSALPAKIEQQPQLARDVPDAQVPRRPWMAESGPDRMAGRYAARLSSRFALLGTNFRPAGDRITRNSLRAVSTLRARGCAARFKTLTRFVEQGSPPSVEHTSKQKGP